VKDVSSSATATYAYERVFTCQRFRGKIFFI